MKEDVEILDERVPKRILVVVRDSMGDSRWVRAK